MKDGKILILIGLIGLFVTFSILLSAQSATFSMIRFVDKYGLEERHVESKIRLLPGAIEVTENGATWQEEIKSQTKGMTYCRIVTSAGEYTCFFNDRLELVAVHLRSMMGADRSYLNPVKTKRS